MTDTPDYVPPSSPPAQAVHNEPPRSAQWEAMSQDQLNSLRGRLIESIVQVVVQAVTGLFVPGGGVGGALTQLTSWANNIPILGTLVQAITGSLGNLTDLTNFFNFANPVNLLSGLINGVVGGSGNPLSNLISSLLGTASTASTANTNATTSLGNWTSLLAGIPGVSTVAGFLGFLQPTGSDRGIFGTLINGVVGGTTNPLSSLISSFLGTASTASTANTNATTSLGNWTTLLSGVPGVSNISTYVTWLTDLLSLLGSPTGMGSGTPAASPVARIPLIGGILNGLFGAFAGITDQDATQAQVGVAAEGLASSVSGNNAQLLQLAAAMSPGNQDSETFEFSNGSSWGANWRTLKSDGGTVSVNGHDGVFTASYGADEEMIGLRLLKQALGDNQTVSVACATASGAITDGNAAVDLWLRCTNFTTYATRTGLRMRFWGNKALELHWFNSGTGTLITSGTSSVNFSATSTFSFEAGQGLSPRRFIAKVNGTTVLDFPEVGTTSQYGANYKHRGVGLRGEFSLLFIPPLEMQPAKLKQWTATG